MTRILISTVAAMLLVGTAPLAAQSAEEILQTAMTRYQERMQGVENYTVVQEVMGTQSTVYFEKETVDGVSGWQPRMIKAGGQSIPVEQGSSESAWNTPYQQFPELAQRARYDGTEAVGGEQTYMITIDDFRGLDFAPPASGDGNAEFTPERMTMYIDTDNYVLRRMNVEGETSADGRTVPVTMTMTFDDYRTTDGMLHPWTTTMVMDGMMEASGMSAEEQEKAREQLAEMEKQMAEMPAAQRQMMERMMGGQMQKLREMVETGSMEVTTQVKDVQVNQGPPQGS